MKTWLFHIRKNKDLTMAEVAKESGISESYYSMIESGDRNASVDTAKKIGSVLGFDWTKFFEDEKEEA